jgi:hypothetical protein
MDETALRIAIAMALGLVLIATIVLTGSPRRSLPAPVTPAAAAPPPRMAQRPVVQVELTRAEVKRQLTALSALLLELDGSAIPKEKVGPLWRELMQVRERFEAPEAELELGALARRLSELEKQARALLATQS